jgi:hypothetical protein
VILIIQQNKYPPREGPDIYFAITGKVKQVWRKMEFKSGAVPQRLSHLYQTFADG